MQVITIPYRPRAWQKEVHEDKSRFKVIVAHRRSGKTTMCVNELLRYALSRRKSRLFYIAPTYRQAKVIAWEELKHFLPFELCEKINEAELLVKLKNGSIIELKGADNPDSLRGVGLDGVVFDEYSQQPSNIYSEIISPALADKKGWAIWIGTPKGKNLFYELFMDAAQKPGWRTWLLRASTSGIIEPDELARIRLDSDDNEYNQEMECSFESSIKGAVYTDEWSQLIKDGRLSYKAVFERHLPTFSSWDFGIGDATSIGIYQVEPASQEVRLIDYVEASDKPLIYFIDWLKTKPYNLARINYGDPSGQNRNLNTGRSIFEDLADANIPLFARRTSEIDKIHATKKLLAKLWVNPQCEKFIKAITNYHYIWDDKRGEYKKEPYHDWSSHAMDQLGYFAVNYIVPELPLSNVERKLKELKNQFYE